MLTRCPATIALNWGDPVVIRSPRGLELGTVLGEATAASAAAAGEILRLATPGDQRDSMALQARAARLLQDLQALATERDLPLLPLDADLLLDGSEGFIQVLHWGEVPFTAIQEELAARHGVKVAFLDAGITPHNEADHGCGSGNCSSCGSGGGGCSESGCGSGSCSRGSVSADELTAYFANLREAMEHRIPLA